MLTMSFLRRLSVSVLLTTSLACSTTPNTIAAGGAQDGGAQDGGAQDGDAQDGDAQDGDAQDSSATDAATADAATSASVWWTCSDWENAKGTKPPRNISCETKVDDGTYGCKAPWYGDKHGGLGFTCNLCPGGDPLVQARWRAVDFNTEDPSKPMAGDHKEVLTIDGNTWHLRAEHTDKGVVHKVRVDGWYWCSDAVELKTASDVFHATAKEGSDFFGWFAPDIFTGLFLTKGTDQLAWSYNEGFETKKAGDALYCRIGSTIKGKPCTDPFK